MYQIHISPQTSLLGSGLCVSCCPDVPWDAGVSSFCRPKLSHMSPPHTHTHFAPALTFVFVTADSCMPITLVASQSGPRVAAALAPTTSLLLPSPLAACSHTATREPEPTSDPVVPGIDPVPFLAQGPVWSLPLTLAPPPLWCPHSALPHLLWT